MQKPSCHELQSRPRVVTCEIRVQDCEAPGVAQVSRRAALAVALAGVGVFSPQNHHANAIAEGKQTNLSIEQVKV